MPNKPNKNHADAASIYGSSAQKNETNQRELEGRILLKSAKMLKDLQDDWDSADKDVIEQTLLYNRKLWMLFYDTAIENKGEGHDSQIRSNIINLANFIFKRELQILSNPQKEKLNVLVSINKEIAAGLMTSPASDQQAHPEAPTENTSSSTTIESA